MNYKLKRKKDGAKSVRRGCFGKKKLKNTNENMLNVANITYLLSQQFRSLRLLGPFFLGGEKWGEAHYWGLNSTTKLYSQLPFIFYFEMVESLSCSDCP